MTTVVRPVTYSNTLQRLVVTSDFAGTISAELWGGGGGGGGYDSGIGGYGSGGGYSKITFNAVAGDIIDVAVGGAGGGGASGARPAAGGSAGASYVPAPSVLFNSISPPVGQQPAVYQVTNRSYCSFLNTYGVWGDPTGAAGNFSRTYTFNAPYSGFYQIQSSCDNYGTVSIDGTVVLNVNGYTNVYTVDLYIVAGTHTISTVGVNTGGPGSMGTIVSSLQPGLGASYSGAYGGAGSLAFGTSGGGGGGGGATVLLKNGSVIAVAGGGAGGGGAGNEGARDGQNAPGSAGRAAPGTNAGQNGQSNGTDGGGGGAGGGGYGGGNGGTIGPGYDTGALAGASGGSVGDSTADPSNINPAVACPYGASGTGGTAARPGNSGIAVFTFDVIGLYVKSGSVWEPVQETYIKHNNVWTPVQEIWTKQNNEWKLVTATNATAPVFTTVSGNFGVDSRIYPPPPPPDYSGGGWDGSGWAP